MEKVVRLQLLLFLKLVNIPETFQTGFKSHHNTETTLLKVMNYLLIAVDTGDNAILILLDLTTAFDTIDHNTLLSCREHWVGIKYTALDWIYS